MKKVAIWLTIIACVLCLVACSSNTHTCRPLDYNEVVDLQPLSQSNSFVTDAERDELLNKAVRDYLDSFEEQSVSFTYEITSTHFGEYEGKETILYWLKIVYDEGFTTVMGFIIQ